MSDTIPNGVVSTSLDEFHSDPHIEVRPGTTTLEVKDGPIVALSPDISALFVTPTSGSGTRVATLMGRCVVPVTMGVLDVPEKLLSGIKRRSERAEKMLPLTAVEVYKRVALFMEKFTSRAAGIAAGDAVTFFYSDALENLRTTSPNLVDTYCQGLFQLCNDVAVLEEHYSSQGLFHLTQNLQQSLQVDPDMVVTPLQNQLIRLNRMSAGMGGYLILALLKIVDDVRALITDASVRSMYGESNAISLFSRLGYRTEPKEMLLHKQIIQLSDLVSEYAEGTKPIQNQMTITLISLCRSVKVGLTEFLAARKTKGAQSKTDESGTPPLEVLVTRKSKKVDEGR